MSQHAQDIFGKLAFNYFDLFVVIWLVVGILRGRKLGMSQELLPMFKWVAIVLLAGLFYRDFSVLIRQNTGFGQLSSNLTAYFLIMIGVLVVFTWLKKLVGEKLLGSDIFGRSEYYLGMLGGMIRYACMLLALLAVMNSRVYTKSEIDAYEKKQKKELDSSFFPSYSEVQYAILIQSFSGRQVKDNLSPILIRSVTPDVHAKPETPAKKEEDRLNEVIGTPKK